ncbi:MAG: GNAT family N-acetyltransferase [Bacillota bacterium]|nr:GNAT family N-acetyltransferase [Bacillota bacterium]
MDILCDEGRFYLGGDKTRPVSEVNFERVGDRLLVVVHTFTVPGKRNQGIARKLVERVAQYAREGGYKVKATCPYAKKVLSEEVFADVFIE